MLNLKSAQTLSYDELRAAYREYLLELGLSKNTIQTAYSDTFYLWRKSSPEEFWAAVTADDFENAAKVQLTEALHKNSTGNAESLVNGYLSHLRRFRAFVFEGGKTVTSAKPVVVRSKSVKSKQVPDPSPDQVEHYLQAWDALENYHLQEDALDKLFFTLCPKNSDLSDILLKVAVLNDFYSTNIFSVYPVAKHILSLNIDARLKAGDVTLVSDIQKVTINGVEKNFYSFATKYCSHHNPLGYPIYDSYVEKVLCYYRDQDGFAQFKREDLKDYVSFKGAQVDFRTFYGLGRYDLKQIDKYIWQLGKEYFPKNYGKSK